MSVGDSVPLRYTACSELSVCRMLRDSEPSIIGVTRTPHRQRCRLELGLTSRSSTPYGALGIVVSRFLRGRLSGERNGAGSRHVSPTDHGPSQPHAFEDTLVARWALRWVWCTLNQLSDGTPSAQDVAVAARQLETGPS
jgi:hypothetical protein